MNTVKAMIDGKVVNVGEGVTILEGARIAGIEIPTLCYHPDLTLTGNCRVCVVEVEGAKTLAGACHTPLTEGMVIHTRSPKVLAARRVTVELLMAGHTGECVTDEHTSKCELRRLADQLEGEAPRFRMRRPRWFPVEEGNPYVRRDMSRCILCRKCIGACREVARKDVYGMAYRGFSSKVVVDFDGPLTTEVCRDCGICIDYCPTGALKSATGKGEERRVSQETLQTASQLAPQFVPMKGRERAMLLERLKRSQKEFGCVPGEFIVEAARSLGLSISEVYGLTTFYGFLSSRPLGRVILRICKSVPCYLKSAEMVIGTVEREIGIKPGETTPDHRFSFELTNCIGACDMAPAMLVNDKIYGHLTPEKITEILGACQ